jgi:murein DD-endopeptidase MepM/ murein hydrolase activator NlpD
VALFATVASARLFLHGHGETQTVIDSREDYVAGHVTGGVIETPEIPSPAPPPIIITLTLDRSAYVASYLEDAGVSHADALRWAAYFHKATASKTLARGHSLSLYRDPETGELRGLKYNVDERVAVTENTYGDGVIRASQELIRYVVRPITVSFQLQSDFSHEARLKDLPKPIVATLQYAFNDRHALNALPRGSDIKLIYQEKVSRDGTAHIVTGLQAAQIRFGGKTLSAFAFRDEDGAAHLYDANGEALGPRALRFPVSFQYISSGFTTHRYHPILHRYRPHAGVDLAAHYGAPVAAIADGRVESAGWCGELGRCVRIQHEGGIVSLYGHLSEITPGMEGDTRVRVGQLIGRVGSSGLSTGPHLHYAIEKDGRFVNPLTQSLGTHHRVSPRMRALFDRFKQSYLTILNRNHDVHGHVSVPAAAYSGPHHTTIERKLVIASAAGIARRPTSTRARSGRTKAPISARASVSR